MGRLRKGLYDAALVEWIGHRGGDESLMSLLHGKQGVAPGGPTIDALLEAHERASASERPPILKRLHRALAEAEPITCLYAAPGTRLEAVRLGPPLPHLYDFVRLREVAVAPAPAPAPATAGGL
jgi:hypothetical protein